MDPSAIQAAPPPPPPQPAASEPGALPSIQRPSRSLGVQILEAVASLRITVVLFVLSLILVFYGTWAQIDSGTWTAVSQYFRSIIVWIPLDVLFLKAVDKTTLAVPYPGGWLLGGLLLTNLLAAHLIRFRMTWKRSGIFMIHGGIILMMLGEFVTGMFAVEGHMVIAEGGISNYVEEDRAFEIALVDTSDPKEIREILVPFELMKPGTTLSSDKLPFDLKIEKYFVNSDLRGLKPDEKARNLATAGIGLRRIAIERPEGSGVDSEGVDFPAAYVTLIDPATAQPLGTYLLSTYLTTLQRPPDTVTHGGKTYEISLRPRRTYRDFSLRLDKFEHNVYPGTTIPKDYSSYVRLQDETQGEDRDVRIYMNHPLRYRGETFYQARLHPLAHGTVLAVVRNPGWLMPYISTIIVSLGMMVHFGITLVGFLQKRAAA